MRCRCGNEIKHVPEHLQGLASWLCQECTNVAPRQSMTVTPAGAERKEPAERGRKKAA